MVKALRLTIIKHLITYKVVQIRKDLESNVFEICQVPLSIERYYQDIIDCNVLEMDACHILLGRLWKFEKKTSYIRAKITHIHSIGMKKNIIMIP